MTLDRKPGDSNTDEPPVVAIYNNLETFYKFLLRTDDHSILEARKYRGDRALFWLGEKKLVIVSSDIPTAYEICQRYGYYHTCVLTPKTTSWQLSLDICRDPDIVRAIVNFAGENKEISLVPYATTREIYRLADYLTIHEGLSVQLPESPDEDDFWVRDFFDTKLGFRQSLPAWIDREVYIPMGFSTQDMQTTASMVAWFGARGLNCVVKPDKGESGLGMQVFTPDMDFQDIVNEIRNNRFLDNDILIVEEYIQLNNGLSPSLEIFIPKRGMGEPKITYLSNQHFEKVGRFSGLIISKHLKESSWYPALCTNGLKIASHLQEMGYAGHFDLDTAVDRNDRVYLLEVNTRRTGGTFAHEFAKLQFGADYNKYVTLLSINSVSSCGIDNLDELFGKLQEILFPIHSEPRGVVVTVTSRLKYGEFGCLVIDRDFDKVIQLRNYLDAILLGAYKRF